MQRLKNLYHRLFQVVDPSEDDKEKERVFICLEVFLELKKGKKKGKKGMRCCAVCHRNV